MSSPELDQRDQDGTTEASDPVARRQHTCFRRLDRVAFSKSTRRGTRHGESALLGGVRGRVPGGVERR